MLGAREPREIGFDPARIGKPPGRRFDRAAGADELMAVAP